MKESVLVSDIFQRDVVGDNVLFQPAGQGFPQNWLGVKIIALGGGGHEEVGTQLSFGGQDASADGGAGLQAEDVVGKLTIEKTCSILAPMTCSSAPRVFRPLAKRSSCTPLR